jgi:hypothetical protein
VKVENSTSVTVSIRRRPKPHASRCGPRQQHDFAAEAALIDTGMGFAGGGKRQPIDHDGMNGASA